VQGEDLVSFFYLWISSIPSTTYERGFLSTYVLGAIVRHQMTVCLSILLDLLFYSNNVCVCFCASTMLLLLLCLCSIAWSQVLWYLTKMFWFFFFSVQGLLCLHMEFRIFFLFLWRMWLGFWWGFDWICIPLLVIWPFYKYLFCWPMSIGGSFISYCLLQCFIVFIVDVLHIFVKFMLGILVFETIVSGVWVF
jgi:hypothetical protein